MAQEADIMQVKDLLPSDSDWDDPKISAYLDAPNSINRVLLLYWEGRAAKLYTAIDVNESGSSRSLSQIYQNAQRMAEYWRDRVATDIAQAQIDDARIAFHPIRRV